jgi:protein involved in polysaccharide export with SLBB domain
MFAEWGLCLPNFSCIVGLMADDMDWARLGQYVRRARGPRTQKAIRAAGGPTDTTIGKIESNEWRPTRGVDKTLEKLEKGLGWQPGDAARVLSGDEPRGSVEVQPTPARIVLLSDVPTFDLLDELRNRVVSFDDAEGRDRIAAWSERGLDAVRNHGRLYDPRYRHQ